MGCLRWRASSWRAIQPGARVRADCECPQLPKVGRELLLIRLDSKDPLRNFRGCPQCPRHFIREFEPRTSNRVYRLHHHWYVTQTTRPPRRRSLVCMLKGTLTIRYSLGGGLVSSPDSLVRFLSCTPRNPFFWGGYCLFRLEDSAHICCINIFPNRISFLVAAISKWKQDSKSFYLGLCPVNRS